jgi:hypothetical protein
MWCPKAATREHAGRTAIAIEDVEELIMITFYKIFRAVHPIQTTQPRDGMYYYGNWHSIPIADLE